jgi:hypothetical protein
MYTYSAYANGEVCLCERRSKTYRLGTIRRLHAAAVEKEADGGRGLALALAEGVHQLLQLRSALDLEEDLVVVVRHLDVEVLALAVALGLLLRATRAAVVIGPGHLYLFFFFWRGADRFLGIEYWGEGLMVVGERLL